MEPVSLILGLADLIPSVIGWFSDDKGENEKKAKGVINIAKKLTGLDDAEAAINDMKINSELQIKFKEAVLDYQYKMEQEYSKQLESVNKTMRSEANSEHWMQWSWRPFNGFLFGITLFLGYIIPALVNVLLATFNVTNKVITSAPFLGGSDIVNEIVRTVPYAQIPEFVLVAWGSVLGVTSWWRGKQKAVKTEK